MTNPLDAAIAAMRLARTDLNPANVILQNDLSVAEYNKVHPGLATTSGVLQTAIEAAVAAEAATPAPPTTMPTGTPALGSLIRHALIGTSLDTTLWGPFDFTPVNGVTCDPANIKMTNPGATLFLASASVGAGICGKGKQYYDQSKGFYYEFISTIQKAANGGNANSHANVWMSSDKWPTSGEFDVAETLWTKTKGIGAAVNTLHHGTGNTSTAWDLPDGWTGRHKYGIFMLPTEIILCADPNSDEKLEVMHTWSAADGVSSALGPWYPCIQLGVSNAGDGNWWGQTTVPGTLPIEYLDFYNVA